MLSSESIVINQVRPWAAVLKSIPSLCWSMTVITDNVVNRWKLGIEVLHGSHIGWQDNENYSVALERTFVPKGKRIYCSCHPTWLPCKTYIKHKTAAEHLTWMMYSSTLIVFSFCLWQPLPIFRDCLQVTWLKEPFEIMKVLDPWRLQGVHRLRLTTETTRCSPPKWNTNRCETPTTCHTNPGPAGRALTVRDLVARKDLPAWAPVTCRRGTRICRRELRFLCKRSKNRSLILYKGDLRTVRNRRDVKADFCSLVLSNESFKGWM